jgi:hypothetical protein
VKSHFINLQPYSSQRANFFLWNLNQFEWKTSLNDVGACENDFLKSSTNTKLENVKNCVVFIVKITVLKCHKGLQSDNFALEN